MLSELEKEILTDVLVMLAGQKFPTPEKGFTCWADARSSLERFMRARSVPVVAEPDARELLCEVCCETIQNREPFIAFHDKCVATEDEDEAPTDEGGTGCDGSEMDKLISAPVSPTTADTDNHPLAIFDAGFSPATASEFPSSKGETETTSGE